MNSKQGNQSLYEMPPDARPPRPCPPPAPPMPFYQSPVGELSAILMKMNHKYILAKTALDEIVRVGESDIHTEIASKALFKIGEIY